MATLFGNLTGGFGATGHDTSTMSRGSRGSHGYSHSTGKRSEMEIEFWELFPDEHLWNRVKSLNLYEKANCLILLYNLDDAHSF